MLQMYQKQTKFNLMGSQLAMVSVQSQKYVHVIIDKDKIKVLAS